MQETLINERTALEVLELWHDEGRPVEVLLRFGQGLVQAHSGRITLEPEGQVVVAQVLDRDNYMTTVLDTFAFETIRLSETENVMTFEEPYSSDTLRSVTLACRKR
jgi:hypothetical protein